MRTASDAQAAAWVRWARTPGHDHFFWRLGCESYFAERAYEETRTRGGLTMVFTGRHRPLSAFSRAFEGAGLLVEALREPVPDAEHVALQPSVEQWTRRPAFLAGRALKPPAAP